MTDSEADLEQLFFRVRHLPAKRRRRGKTRFGIRLRQILRLKGWTQRDLALAMGTSAQNVSAVLRSKHPHAKTVLRLAKALDVLPENLREGVDYGERPAEGPSSDVPTPEDGASTERDAQVRVDVDGTGDGAPDWF